MNEIFHIAPATVRWGGLWAILGMTLVIVVVVLGFAGYAIVKSVQGSRSSTFELSSEGLRLRGDMYGRMIPASQLVPAEARVVDIADGPYRPTFRSSGTAMAGYRSGWFKLRNGRKALLYVTDPNRVVLVPTTAGYDVLLSVAETPRFLDRLHRMADAP